jgi:hypothetical protein
MSTAFLRSPTGESSSKPFASVSDTNARKEYNINEYAN